MSKIIQYFYIFSKLTTSIVFLLIIIIMGYLLFISYQEIDQSKEDLDSEFLSLSQSIADNAKNLTKIENELFQNIDNINKLENVLEKINLNIQDLNVDKEINELFIITKKLEKNLNNKKDNKNIDIVEQQKFNNINSLIDLILEKYKLGQKINAELDLLENIIPNNEKIIIEKLRVLEINKFYGFEYLNQLFDKLIDNYIKNFFLEKNQNIVIKYLSKYISIRPAQLNKYENNNLNILFMAKQKIDSRDIKEALELVLTLDKEKKYFNTWINQVEHYINFEYALIKVKSLD